MKLGTILTALAWSVFSISIHAQIESAKQFVGTVKAVKPDSRELDIKIDNGTSIVVSAAEGSVIQKVAPGEKDLARAEAILVTDIAAGDRVLVALKPGSTHVRRLVVMPARDLAKRDESDREAWNARGISGVVTAKIANQITLMTRSFEGQVEVTVNTDDKTVYRRYQPESVKFSDAKPSSIEEVRPGDQLRARGAKREDGKAFDADAIIFGSFQTKAGTISTVDVPSGTLTLKELNTGKPLTVRITADSRLKEMPDFGPMARGGAGPGSGEPPGPGDGPPKSGGNTPPMFPGRGGAPPDFAQMIDAMPAITLATLKAGQTVVVSSTKGPDPDSLTAVILLANADRLIQMASARRGRGTPRGVNGPAQASGSDVNGLGAFDLPGIIP